MVQGETAAAAQENPASPAHQPHPTSPPPADADWISVLPDARVIFVAGGVLFLLGHGGTLFAKPPAGPLTFLVTCFIWSVLFGYPAYLAFQKRRRGVATVIATLFLLVAGLDLAIPVYIRYETEPLLREPRAELPKPGPPDFIEAALNPASAVPGYLQQALREEKSWDLVQKELRDAFGVDSEKFRQPYQLELTRRKQALKGESRLELVVRRALPIGGPIGQLKRAERYRTALERLNAGKANQEDIEVVVRYELLEEINPQGEKVR